MKPGEGLVAALMLSETLPPALEQAALAVDAADPAYVTKHYLLAPEYRLAGSRPCSNASAFTSLGRSFRPRPAGRSGCVSTSDTS